MNRIRAVITISYNNSDRLWDPCHLMPWRCWCREPHCSLMPLPREPPPVNIRINLILPESKVIGLLFCYGSVIFQVFVVGSERCIFSAIKYISAIQVHPTSLILASIKRVYVTSYQSFIVTLVLSYSVSEIRRLVAWKLLFFTTLSFNALAFECLKELFITKAGVLALSVGEDFVMQACVDLALCQTVIDRQTDRETSQP